MLSVDIANKFISGFGDKAVLSNLSLNKLVYFAQVESLRSLGSPSLRTRLKPGNTARSSLRFPLPSSATEAGGSPSHQARCRTTRMSTWWSAGHLASTAV